MEGNHATVNTAVAMAVEVFFFWIMLLVDKT